MALIRVTRAIAIDPSEMREEFVRASGPGGQNVNRVSTAVQLRFDTARSPSLSDDVRQRLRALAGRRITEAGVLVIDARRFRSQYQNRRDARERLIALIRQAATPPRARRATRPTPASRARRLATKRRRTALKRLRRALPNEE